MANISAIKLPNGDQYNLIDKTSGYTKNTGTVTSVAASGSNGISISGSPITTSGTIAIGLNLSTAINGLGEGTSPAQRADYIVAQYAGGGTTTTTYHRRSLAKIFAALNASDITTALGYTPYDNANPSGYTTNTGTVTKVTAGTGLSIGTTAGGNFTTTGTINHTNSVTAQATQAVYPIKIDGQGHISAYGSAVTSMPASDVYSWAKASSKPSYTASEVGAIASTAKGANNGVAELDANGKVPSAQLPSFVDDVLEYNNLSSFPSTGETGKIYVAKDTNKTYRWGGSSYVEISPSLALGETSSTAYRGDRGKTAYDHSQTTHARTDATAVAASSTNGNIKIDGTETTVYTHPGSGTNPHGTTASDVGLGNVGNFKAVSTVANQGLTSTEQSNARANIGAGTSSLTIGTTSSTAAAGNHTHNYAGSSSAGGAANSLVNFKVTTTTNLGVDAPGTNAVGYISGLTKANWNYQQTDGALYTQWYSASWIHEIFGDYRTGQISVRGKNNNTWQSWRRILDESNWTTFITIPTTLPASDVYAWAKAANKPTYSLSEITSADDIKAIEALSGTNGFLKKTAANTWALDTSTYLTGITSAMVTTALGYTPYNGTTNPNGYTTNEGTVTSITLKAGGGISLDTDNTAITTSGTRTISHADTSSQGSSSNSGRTYIQSITLDTYGHVTGISTATETVTNTDTKVSTAAVTSGTTYYPVVGADTTSAATKFYDKTGFSYLGTNGTTSAVGVAAITLGNSTGSGTANNKQGQLIMYGSNTKKATITLATPGADVALALPTSSGTLALTSQIPTVPSSTGSSETNISIAAHGTGTVIGVQSTTTTASKVTVGSHSTDYGVKSAGSASTWTFEEKTIPNVTAAGSGTASLVFTMDTTDTKKLKITFSHTHTPPTIGTAIKVQSKSGGANSTAPTLGSKVPTVSASNVDVPIKNSSASTFVTGTTHTITDTGHTHTI